MSTDSESSPPPPPPPPPWTTARGSAHSAAPDRQARRRVRRASGGGGWGGVGRAHTARQAAGHGLGRVGGLRCGSILLPSRQGRYEIFPCPAASASVESASSLPPCRLPPLPALLSPPLPPPPGLPRRAIRVRDERYGTRLAHLSAKFDSFSSSVSFITHRAIRGPPPRA